LGSVDALEGDELDEEELGGSNELRGDELDEEELGGSNELRGDELDEEELGGSNELRGDELDEEELDSVEFDTDEFAVNVELGEEVDDEELGGSNELRGDELDEEFNGEEPIPCINESIVLSIIFPRPTLFKRLFISVSMLGWLESLFDCADTIFNN
jgi:hypothetical protein